MTSDEGPATQSSADNRAARFAARRLSSAGALLALVIVLLAPAVLIQRFMTGLSTHMPAPVTEQVAAPTPITPSSPTPAVETGPTPTAVPSPTPLPHESAHVGIQIGHLQACDVPDELSKLRCAWGVSGDGWAEVVVNKQIALLVSDGLEREGVRVDLLPTTVPEGYKADLFLALHADAYEEDERMNGFKVARSIWSKQPKVDDLLVQDLVADYGAATGLRESKETISDNMTEYYAFDYLEFHHAISPETPAAIIEMGFLSNDSDREVLLYQQGKVAQGIVRAVLDFLDGSPQATP